MAAAYRGRTCIPNKLNHKMLPFDATTLGNHLGVTNLGILTNLCTLLTIINLYIYCSASGLFMQLHKKAFIPGLT